MKGVARLRPLADPVIHPREIDLDRTGARSLADKHQLGFWIAHAKDNLLSSLFVEHATLAVAEVFADDLQRLHRVADAVLWFQSDYVENIFFNPARNRDHCGLAWTHLFSSVRRV